MNATAAPTLTATERDRLVGLLAGHTHATLVHMGAEKGSDCAECAAMGYVARETYVVAGEEICPRVGQHRVAPEVGMGATINLYTDSQAAVIVAVTATTVKVRRVATTEPRRSEHHDQGPYPVLVADGILDQPEGEVETFRLRKRTGRFHRSGASSITLSVGHSTSLTDYRV